MANPQETIAASVLPHNVLGMAVKSVYLTDPMNAPQATSTEGEPDPSDKDENDTSPENPSTGEKPQDHDWKKRHGDLKSHTDKVIGELKSSMTDLKAQVTGLTAQLNAAQTSKESKMPKTPEEFNVFRKEYPDLADLMLTAALMAHEQSSSEVNTKLKRLEEKSAEAEKLEALQTLKQYHPDILEIKDDPKFHEWFHAQPIRVKELIRSSNVQEVAEGIDLYKYKAGIKKTTKEKNESAKNATRQVTSNTHVEIESGAKRIWKESEINRLSDADFEKHQDDIKAAPYEGRYLAGQ